jgi:hypothetical protein
MTVWLQCILPIDAEPIIYTFAARVARQQRDNER